MENAKNLNTEKIIKALQGHIGVVDIRCEECSYNQDNGSEICINLLMTDSLALIESYEKKIKELTEENNKLYRLVDDKIQENKRLTEENEWLKARVFEENHLRHQVEEILANGMNTVKADTIDEFVKMAKEKMREVATGKRTSLIGTGWIDEIARELKGE